MNTIRRRLASGALVLSVLQFALLFTAPVSACCASAQAGHQTKVAAAKAIECCPPGSHAPGQCPLHRGSKVEDRGSNCRMQCDAPHGPQFLLGVTGVIAAPPSTFVALVASVLPAGAPLAVTARPSLPDAPPPRLL